MRVSFPTSLASGATALYSKGGQGVASNAAASEALAWLSAALLVEPGTWAWASLPLLWWLRAVLPT